MAAHPPDRTSLWHGTAATTAYPPLAGDVETDVVVVGAGSTGLTTAATLADAGLRVVVVEARHIAAGTTGGTTGKVTSQHGVRYRDLIARHGEDAARAYGQANEAAIGAIRALCERHDVDADLEPADAYIYAQDDREVDQLQSELQAARRLGLPAEWAPTTELPYQAAGALRFTGQAQMHAVKYCEGLARAVAGHAGGAVHTRSRVTAVEETDGRVVVTTEGGRVTADHAMLATLAPITDRGFEFARQRPVRAYGVAAVVDGEVPEGMYISAGSPGRSVRHYHDGERAYVIVVGASHEVGHERHTEDNDEALARFAREHFGATEIPYRWSAQDFTPDDRLPFVGRTPFSEHIHVATGFQKWGLTMAAVTAELLTARIQGRDHPLGDVLSPRRRTITESAKQFLEHNAGVAARFVADRVRPDVASIDEIPPGGGATVRVGSRILAVSKDEDGEVTTRSATCTHLGCIVQWNRVERSWDCPCHGSRYDAEGAVLDGPTKHPLREP